MRIAIATIKPWNIKNAYKLKKEFIGRHETYIITQKEELTYERLSEINPEFVFFPHWSWIIPKIIYENFVCIVFHMTDLPFGRGGSPLQNLIERGVENTKISALKVDGGIDTGNIYLKKDLNLNGGAEEIFIRASRIIFGQMIPEIIDNDIIPQQQSGSVVEFKRRQPEQSELMPEFTMKKIFDYIRMLDAEGYPKAFIEFGKFRLQFSRPCLKEGKIIADVEIIGGDEHE